MTDFRGAVYRPAEEGEEINFNWTCEGGEKNKCGSGQPPKPHCYRGCFLAAVFPLGFSQREEHRALGLREISGPEGPVVLPGISVADAGTWFRALELHA